MGKYMPRVSCKRRLALLRVEGSQRASIFCAPADCPRAEFIGSHSQLGHLWKETPSLCLISCMGWLGLVSC